MSEKSVSLVTSEFNKLNMIQSSEQQRQLNNSCQDLEAGEEASSPDSTTHNYLAGSYRCEKFEYSSTSNNSNLTITPASVQNIRRDSIMPEEMNNYDHTIQIPIVGYEVMEERARFTVYKLRVENKSSGDCWYVFRRYTDFVRLGKRLKHTYPSLAVLMPRKKYFGNNFDPRFLEERIRGLQTFVNAVISIPELIITTQIQDFFCLNEPPAYSDTTEESRAIFEALEDTIYHLRHQLREKESIIDNLQLRFSEQTSECDHLRTFLRNSTQNCQKCSKDYENYQKTITDQVEEKDSMKVTLLSDSLNTK